MNKKNRIGVLTAMLAVVLSSSVFTEILSTVKPIHILQLLTAGALLGVILTNLLKNKKS